MQGNHNGASPQPDERSIIGTKPRYRSCFEGLHPSDPSAPSLPAAVAHHRIGVMRCCWGKLDFATHCRLAAEVGASFVEDFAKNLEPAKLAPEAETALRDHNVDLLAVIASHLDCRDPAATAESLQPAIENWQRLGLSTFVVLRTGRDHEFEAFLPTLEACAGVVRAAGLTPLTQNHVKGRVESPEELLRCRETGVALHFDTQQFAMCGHPPLAAWDLLGPFVHHVHLGDRDAERQAVAFGTGAVGMEALLRRMHASGYRGAFTLETEYGPGDAGTLPIVQQAHDFVRDCLEPLAAVGVKAPGHAVVGAASLPKMKAAWGDLHWVASDAVFASCAMTVGLVTIRPGERNPRHAHPQDQEIIIIQSGTCLHACDDRHVRLNAGDVLFLQPGQAHQAFNDGDTDCRMVVCYPSGRRSFSPLDGQEE